MIEACAQLCIFRKEETGRTARLEEVNITSNERDNSRFISELWDEVRPYALHLLKDLIVSLLLRVCVWSFHFVGHLMPISGWIDNFLNNIHSAGAIASFGVFVGLSARDIWQIGKSRRHNIGR
jgi:hypothetical protein